MSDPGTEAYVGKMSAIARKSREPDEVGPAQAAILDVQERLTVLQRENEGLRGLLTHRVNEVGLLQMSLNEAHERIRLQDEQWLVTAGGPQAWLDFKQRCIDHVRQLEAKIQDLRNQLEAERRSRVWHAQNSVDTARVSGAKEILADRVLEADKRRRQVSLQRLRRARRAEQQAAKDRLSLANMTLRVENAEAELRVTQATVKELQAALRQAQEDPGVEVAKWRLKAEEWEEKYKDAVVNEAKKWEHAVATWQARYEDALRRLGRCEAELKWHGGERDD
jgi:hypothetical protein